MSDKLNQLKKELYHLKTDFTRRIDNLEQQIRFFEDQLETSQAVEPSFVTDTPALKTDNRPQEAPPPIIKKQLTEETPAAEPPPDGPNPAAPGPDKNPGKKETSEIIATGLAETILPVFGPASALFTKLISVYRHYHSQGKAPVFFMTVAGILTLVMGVGYLLQYSFSQFLGPVGKTAIGFTAALLVTVCGIALNRKRPDMADYASSLIGLGMILSYLSTYFAGPFYRLLPDVVTFILSAALTGIAYILAVLFKTRIVAIISLLGGTFAPLFMAGAMQSHLVYLSYILVLMTATLFLSFRITWPTLAYTGMIVSFVVIEFIISILSAQTAGSMGMMALIHLFFYVFCIYNGSIILKHTSLTRVTIVLFSTNIFFFLFTLSQIVTEHNFLGSLYLLNALILSTVFLCIPVIIKSGGAPPDCKKPLQAVCMLSSGLLAGFGILSVTAPEFLGLVWGGEALILFLLGTRYNILQVRIESFLILALSFILSTFYSGAWIMESLVPPPQFFQLESGYGWMNLMVTWILLAAFVFLMERADHALLTFEKKWLYGCNEVLSVCLSLAFSMTVGLVWNDGIWLMGVVPMFFLIYRSKTKHLPFTEYFGLSHFLLLAVPMVTSAGIVESFYFSEQLPLGKIARAEAFLCLYAIAEFYRRWYANSRLNNMAQMLRTAFFCLIPVSFLPGVWHQFGYFFPISVWLSAVICLLLFCWLKSSSLLMELKLLVIGSSLISVAACALVRFAGWQGYGFPALTAGLIFFGLVLFFWKGLQQTPAGSEQFLATRKQLSLFFSFAFYYLGAFWFILIYGTSGSAPLALTFMTGYFSFLFFKLPIVVPLRNKGILIYVIVGLSAAAMALTHSTMIVKGNTAAMGIHSFLYRHGLFSITVLGLYGLLVHQRHSHFIETRKKLGGSLTQFRIFHILTCLTYVGALSSWFNDTLGPALSVALVLHATVVVFLTLKDRFQKLISLAVILFVMAAGKIIFFDMNDFSLIQKMIAFIIIGTLLLAAAFQYQKMNTAKKSYNDEAA